MNIKEQIRAEIERRINALPEDWLGAPVVYEEYQSFLSFLDTLPEQPVSDHHEIEVEFRGEKVTINREFYRDGERNYSTGEQDDNAIWSALRAWCEKKGITPFELYPKQSEQPVEYPTSTEMIAEWENNELPMLREKDFRGDAERMAYNAFMDGFAKGLGYNKK